MLTLATVKIHNHFLFYSIFTLIALLHFSCQKKEVLQAEKQEPVDTVKPPLCPDCEFPDSVWKNVSSSKQLIFRLKFDSTQARLNDLGQISIPTAGTGAQSPIISGMSINYIELMPETNSEPGAGVVVYKTAETTCGGAKALNFCKGVVVKENEVLVSVDISTIPLGAYSWIRISISFQEIKIKTRSVSTGNTLATFVGFSADLCYLSKLKIQNAVLTPTLGSAGNKSRGYWMCYQQVFNTAYQLDGQSPNTTVTNPNQQISNSGDTRFVYGQFINSANSSIEPLVITGNETSNKEVILSLSSNKSFEWKEITFDGLFQPDIGEKVLDFGCRGLIPKF